MLSRGDCLEFPVAIGMLASGGFAATYNQPGQLCSRSVKQAIQATAITLIAPVASPATV
jgi:hypothetical protein